ARAPEPEAPRLADLEIGEVLVIISTLINRIKAYLRYRRSVEALSRLTDRELADIGIDRWNIDTVARDVAQA
ncbi:MAG: DUF1127 domain-containing protein, partial [Hyphomonas sp.]|nr:DUF1127 domain-containing protein [Hyphomonas sp.]